MRFPGLENEISRAILPAHLECVPIRWNSVLRSLPVDIETNIKKRRGGEELLAEAKQRLAVLEGVPKLFEREPETPLERDIYWRLIGLATDFEDKLERQSIQEVNKCAHCARVGANLVALVQGVIHDESNLRLNSLARLAGLSTLRLGPAVRAADRLEWLVLALCLTRGELDRSDEQAVRVLADFIATGRITSIVGGQVN